MKYYFGKVSEADVEMFGDEGLFENDGSYYYNMVEFGSNPGGLEDFMISDGCGRNIPISVEQIGALGRVLLDIKMSLMTIANGKEVEDNLYDEALVTTFE